jgi:AMIN domain/Putative MetA-pathway of phenol degradation
LCLPSIGWAKVVNLDAVKFTALSGNKVQVKLEFSGPLSREPLSFTIDDPARIALDLPDTRLNLPSKNQPIGVGTVRSLNAVEAGGRTRVVLNLSRLVPYDLAMEGNTAVITLGSEASSTQTEEAPAVESGAAQAVPSQFEVDEEAAERALERTLVVTGALLLPFGKAEIQPRFAYIRREEDAPIFLEQGRQFIASQEVRRNTFTGNLFLRFGLPFDSQLEVGIPYRYVEQEVVTEADFGARAKTEGHGSGFGDIRLGLAKGLLHERNWWPNLIARVTWDTDSGATSDDGVSLGGGFNELQGSLIMTKYQDPLVFIGGTSYGTTFEKDHINPGDQLSFSVGALLAASPETSLRVVLNQIFVNELQLGDRAISGSDQVIGTLDFGASLIIGRGKFLDLTAGMGLTDEAPDYSVGISLAVRFDIPTRF